MFDSDLDNMFTETRLTSLPEVRLTSDLSRLRKENAWNRLDAEGDHDAVGIIKCSWGFGRGGGGGKRVIYACHRHGTHFGFKINIIAIAKTKRIHVSWYFTVY